MASGERRARRRATRRPRSRERWQPTAADERAAGEAITNALFERVLGPAWERLGPLSTGAVAGSLAIVGARGLLRRVLGRRYGRTLSWVGALALVPVAVWLLAGGSGAVSSGQDDEAGDSQTSEA